MGYGRLPSLRKINSILLMKREIFPFKGEFAMDDLPPIEKYRIPSLTGQKE
jgi:hypothetical protein